jgi:hypothetical protein
MMLSESGAGTPAFALLRKNTDAITVVQDNAASFAVSNLKFRTASPLRQHPQRHISMLRRKKRPKQLGRASLSRE